MKEGDERQGYQQGGHDNFTDVCMKISANYLWALFDMSIRSTELVIEAQRKSWEMGLAVCMLNPREPKSAEIIDFKNHPLVQKKLRREKIVQKETPAEIIFLSEFHR